MKKHILFISILIIFNLALASDQKFISYKEIDYSPNTVDFTLAFFLDFENKKAFFTTRKWAKRYLNGDETTLFAYEMNRHQEFTEKGFKGAFNVENKIIFTVVKTNAIDKNGGQSLFSFHQGSRVNNIQLTCEVLEGSGRRQAYISLPSDQLRLNQIQSTRQQNHLRLG